MMRPYEELLHAATLWEKLQFSGVELPIKQND